MKDILLAIGLHLASPTNDELMSAEAYEARAGYKNTFLYGTRVEPSQRVLGQNMGSLKLTSAGVGVELPLGESKFDLVLKYGKIWAKDNPKEVIKNEVVHQLLVNDHGIERGQPPFHATRFTREVSGGNEGAVGLQYNFTDNFSVGATYSFGHVKHKIDMWDHRIGRHDLKTNEPDCGCWWQGTYKIDTSNVSVGLIARF